MIPLHIDQRFGPGTLVTIEGLPLWEEPVILLQQTRTSRESLYMQRKIVRAQTFEFLHSKYNSMELYLGEFSTYRPVGTIPGMRA